jgi:hypothetical protein
LSMTSDRSRRADPDAAAIRFAHKLADAADAVTMKRFRARDLRIDTKPEAWQFRRATFAP